jgi:hypothetical protein
MRTSLKSQPGVHIRKFFAMIAVVTIFCRTWHIWGDGASACQIILLNGGRDRNGIPMCGSISEVGKTWSFGAALAQMRESDVIDLFSTLIVRSENNQNFQ